MRRKRGTGNCGIGYWRFGASGKFGHVAIAERALGKTLRRGIEVHHVNGNGLDNRPDNLVICTHAYHALLHQRMRALEACGNPSWLRCKFCKQYDSPDNIICYGKEKYHRACVRSYASAGYARRKSVGTS